MSTHKITLPQLSVRLLSQTLSIPGVCIKPEDFYRIGQVQADSLPEVILPKFNNDSEELEWADRLVEFHLTERQRDAVKQAVAEAVRQGKVGSGKYFFRIVSQLGLMPE